MCLWIAAPAAWAHAPGAPPTLATAWSITPLLLPPLLWLALYATGLLRLWRRAGVGHGIAVWEACAFFAGCAVFFVSVVWPLDALGEWSLAAHMAQHMLLLALAPPLLLAGRPVAGLAHALPRRWAQWLHARVKVWQAPAVGALAAATIFHGAVMAVWHVPAAMSAALAHHGLHIVMHLAFLLGGLWFWAAVWQRIREPAVGAGAGVIALVAMMMQMGFVGALLTFSPRLLYPVYAERAPLIGLDPLADQQLAGVLMWVPSCVPYLVGGIWLLVHAFRRIARRQGAA